MIAGFKNPLTGRQVPIEAIEQLASAFPLPLLRIIYRKEKNDERHSGRKITITSGLGCPRKTVIHRAMATYPDPTKMWAMTRGTLLHEQIGLAMGEEAGWVTEETSPESCQFGGTLFGIPMTCRVDAYKADYSELWDWKFRKDGNEYFIDPGGVAKQEDCAQLNMARLLMEQQLSKDLSKMRMSVWVVAGIPVRTEVPLYTEEQLGRIRPGGGKYTVKEIFGMLQGAYDAWGGEPALAPMAIRTMPMVGQEMYTSPRKPGQCACTHYCEVKDTCFELEGGI